MAASYQELAALFAKEKAQEAAKAAAAASGAKESAGGV
eukprot:COSAG05_NODE_25566_length_196_cov_17.402062_1_plen_37_part_01